MFTARGSYGIRALDASRTRRRAWCRGAGALASAGLSTVLGMGPTYVVVMGFYVAIRWRASLWH